jgi:hypothetical protein
MGEEEEVNFRPELIRQELFSTESNAIRIIYPDVVYTLLSPRNRRHTRERNSSRVFHITLPQLKNYKCILST